MQRQSILPGRNTLVGRTALEAAIVHIPDAVVDPEYTWKESQKLGGFRTMLGVPLLREGAPIGVIALTRSTPQPFTRPADRADEDVRRSGRDRHPDRAAVRRAEAARGGGRRGQGSGRDRARRGRARARRGGGRQPGQIDLPRHHEPRDPHAAQRRARHDGGARAPGPRRAAAPFGGDHARLGAGAVAHHRRRARLLEDRGRPAGAGGDRVLACPSWCRARSARFASRREAKGLALNVEITLGLRRWLVGDPTRVRQILFNLVGNAIKFTERGSIRVRPAPTPLGGGQHAPDARRRRYRHRARAPQQCARAVQAVRAGGQLDHAPVRRHRSRPVDRAPAGAPDAWRCRGRERGRRRLDLHRDTGAAGRTGRAVAEERALGRAYRPR